MKPIRIILVMALMAGLNLTMKAQSKSEGEKPQSVDKKKIEMYYFHTSRRCATCNAVEEVSKETVKEYFANNVTFKSINLDEEEGESLAKKLRVSGQTLLIVAGKERIDLTNEGFMNAKNNPEKLKKIIKEKIDPLI